MSIYDKASLVLIPSGTKTSKVYSQKPVNGDGDFTFSRSTAATRVNADGNIEKETQNLLLQSNSFDASANWINTNSTETSGQSGYDGSNDAWKITSTSTSNAFLRQIISFSGVNTISVYAKAGTSNFLLTSVEGGGITWFNLSAGTIGTDASISSNIEDMGSGWYRCSVVWNASITGVRLYVCDADNSAAVTSGNFIYIQDAQVEQGLVARDYIETTTAALYGGITDNVPRLDYTDSSCPALLLEPQRTNGITASEYFDGSNLNNTTISAEYNTADTLSPEGVYNAAKLTATGNFPRYYDFPTIGNNVDVSLSVFAKQGDASVFTIRGNDKSNTAFVVNFDLANGTAELSQFDSLEPTFDIQPFGNGWYRCIVNTNSGSGATAFQIRPISHAQGETGGWSGSNYIYAYGVQYEASASYATSYIPTYGTSVTRNFDECIDAGDNAVIDSTQGTIYGEQKSLETDFSYNYFLAVSDGTNNNRLEIRQSGTALQFLWRVGGTYQGNILLTSAPFSSTIKYALRYSSTDIKLYVNGSLVGTINSPTLYSAGTLNNLQFADGSGGTNFRGVVNNCMYFPTALTDQELIDLTTI
jgi:hypothetical protein